MRDKQRKLLLDLRSSLIGKLNTMPYCIYTDEAIEALLNAKPKTIDELTKVKGFPKEGKRVKGFGEAILAIFNNTDQIEGFTLNTEGKDEGMSVGTTLRRISAF